MPFHVKSIYMHMWGGKERIPCVLPCPLSNESSDHRTGATVAPSQAKPLSRELGLCVYLLPLPFAAQTILCSPRHFYSTGVPREPCVLSDGPILQRAGFREPPLLLFSQILATPAELHPTANPAQQGVADGLYLLHSPRKCNAIAFKRSVPSNCEMVIC